MKFQTVVMVTGCSAWMWAAAATTDVAKEIPVKPPEKSLTELIQDLSDLKYKVREDATLKIWAMGDAALGDLQKASEAPDPEQAYRARELVRKIQLFILPDTDPEIIGWVERYLKASAAEKMDLFTKMQKKRAWRQILKLFAAETNPQVQVQMQPLIEGISVVAARERLMKDDPGGAKEFLEMAPANPAGLMALADFHRSQGTLDEELARAKTLDGRQGAAWRLALYRASGNLEEARKSAIEAGEGSIAASMSLLLGDPMPWLKLPRTPYEQGGGNKLYSELAVKRWEKTLLLSDLEPLNRAMASRNQAERQAAMGSMLLLGQNAAVEQVYVKQSPLEAFLYMESLERIPDAMKALDLDPENPDYAKWVAERFKNHSHTDEDEQEFTGDLQTQELVILANYLERRGLHSENRSAFTFPMEDLAAKDEKGFTAFLGMLFGEGEKSGAPKLAKTIAIKWAGDDAARWDDIVTAISGGQDEISSLWDWLAELNPTASRSDRLDGLLALCHMGTDPGKLAAKWTNLAWKSIDKTPKENRKPLLEQMQFMVSRSGDAINSLRVWEERDPEEKSREDIYWLRNVLYLTAAERWNDAAEYLKNIIRISETKGEPQPDLHACASACLRKAGRIEEADAEDRLVDKLALGRESLVIGNGYAIGSDFERAGAWWIRAVCQADPGSESITGAIELYNRMMLEQGKWKEVAAASEVLARVASSEEIMSSLPLRARELRFQSDFARALSNLKTDREGSIAALDKCHRDFPTDGGMADHFFPGVRKAGLIKEHDEWFKESWEKIMAIVNEFPGCENSANTAGWLASRSRRNLDEGEKLLEIALAVRPEESAYLDTMAEIQFAKGKRAKAVEWSAKAVRSEPLDQTLVLRRQHERFLTAPLPREGM